MSRPIIKPSPLLAAAVVLALAALFLPAEKDGFGVIALPTPTAPDAGLVNAGLLSHARPLPPLPATCSPPLAAS